VSCSTLAERGQRYFGTAADAPFACAWLLSELSKLPGVRSAAGRQSAWLLNSLPAGGDLEDVVALARAGRPNLRVLTDCRPEQTLKGVCQSSRIRGRHQ